ncbi:SgcJ/EcaC family oxidoreductase [[Mycobacterium] holstebronense]|uniref:SgcJ/EcaC family oxidoreductase n=1 Tax=[Mycobacterium] holstebronense TaxID=3064288 RepID=A0ABM9M6A9_9MYCO|nr:SgcJ/EcaC family oxidoreductase [Mycolicibacter sp. MU0102]CAJ1510699.1 SgcJ/EcaC family oxidoreductase [Mycolicibacter sp. MU0102]
MNDDETAIRELIAQQVAGWNAGDPAAYASVFTPDADYVTFLGDRYQGREAIAASYAPLFAKLLRGTRLELKASTLRFVTPDVALIHSRAVVTKNARGPNRGVRINTSVAVRTSAGWLLTSSQNTTHRRLTQRLMRTIVSRRRDTGVSLA